MNDDTASGSNTNIPPEEKPKAKTTDIDLDNPEFQTIWRLLHTTSQSIFMTGRAGTGKSTFLKHIVANTTKCCVVLAPTGIAAVNAGGCTLHSFFKIPLLPLLPDDPEFSIKRLRKRMHYSGEFLDLLKKVELLIIDEISMVRADIIDFVDRILRVHCKEMRKPFGGKQLLLVGDIFQLEPVVTNDAKALLRPYYPSGLYFFNARVFADFALVPIELRKVYRQREPEFVGMLDRMRQGDPADADLSLLNSRVDPEADEKVKDTDFVVTLAARRDTAEEINTAHLGRLKRKAVTYQGEINGEFPANSLPAPRDLTLKVGAQVVFVRNDPEKRWVNGTVGRVDTCTPMTLVVELEDGTKVNVAPVEWENIKYRYDEVKRCVEEEVLGTYTQRPLALAWAMTIHKSQGLTFNNVIIDIGRGAFSAGQTYVALSRCTSLDGIRLRSTINKRDIFVNPAITRFSHSFNDSFLVAEAIRNTEADNAYAVAAREFDKGNLSGAATLFAKAVGLRNDLDRPEAVRLLSRKLQSLNSWKATVDDLRHQLRQRDEQMAALAKEYISMGDDCLTDLDDPRAAFANYHKARSLDPCNTAATVGEAKALVAMEDFGEALELLRPLCDGDAPVREAFLTAAVCISHVEDDALAIDCLLKGIDKFPDSPDLHLAVAKLYEALGDKKNAAMHRQRAKALRRRRDK